MAELKFTEAVPSVGTAVFVRTLVEEDMRLCTCQLEEGRRLQVSAASRPPAFRSLKPDVAENKITCDVYTKRVLSNIAGVSVASPLPQELPPIVCSL